VLVGYLVPSATPWVIGAAIVAGAGALVSVTDVRRRQRYSYKKATPPPARSRRLECRKADDSRRDGAPGRDDQPGDVDTTSPDQPDQDQPDQDQPDQDQSGEDQSGRRG